MLHCTLTGGTCRELGMYGLPLLLSGPVVVPACVWGGSRLRAQADAAVVLSFLSIVMTPAGTILAALAAILLMGGFDSRYSGGLARAFFTQLAGFMLGPLLLYAIVARRIAERASPAGNRRVLRWRPFPSRLHGGIFEKRHAVLNTATAGPL